MLRLLFALSLSVSIANCRKKKWKLRGGGVLRDNKATIIYKAVQIKTMHGIFFLLTKKCLVSLISFLDFHKTHWDLFLHIHKSPKILWISSHRPEEIKVFRTVPKMRRTYAHYKGATILNSCAWLPRTRKYVPHRGGMNVFPWCIAIESNISKFSWRHHSAWALDQATWEHGVLCVRAKSGKDLQNSRLQYVSCVSKEDLTVCPVGLSRVELICRLLRFVVSLDVVCPIYVPRMQIIL